LAGLIQAERRRKRRLWLVAAACGVSVPAIAFGAWLWLRPQPVPIPARVRTLSATTGDVVREVHATGQLEAVTTVQVGAEISGRIESVLVDYNDRVTAGQILARFDRASLEAQRTQIRATLEAARSSLEQAKTDRDRVARDKLRVDQLYATKSLSDADRDNAAASARLAEQRVTAAEAQIAAQQAAFSVAKTNLDHTLIRAPIDGVVITRNVDPGQTVASMLQTPVLFTVAADLRKMHVIAAVDEADIGEVARGQSATFTVNAYLNRTFEGIVTMVRSSPQVVQDVVTYGTEVEVDNGDLALKPGMTASVKIKTATVKDALRVPAAAFQFVPPGEKPEKPEKPSTEPSVWLLTGGALRPALARPGVSDGELTAVTTDMIRPGDAVVYELTPEGRKAYGIAH
jgi:HlyD family secretion protein